MTLALITELEAKTFSVRLAFERVHSIRQDAWTLNRIRRSVHRNLGTQTQTRRSVQSVRVRTRSENWTAATLLWMPQCFRVMCQQILNQLQCEVYSQQQSNTIKLALQGKRHVIENKWQKAKTNCDCCWILRTCWTQHTFLFLFSGFGEPNKKFISTFTFQMS